MRGRLLGLLVLLASVALPAASAAAAGPVFETYRVPTVGGAQINVEVMRPAGAARAPIVLTYSPSNTLSEETTPNLANDSLGQRYVPRGYARAVADVLGTRNSSGCWDYGGAKEQQSGVDLVNFLARQKWSNGKVAMIGGSYDGTTANMVAARGDEVPGLAAIVPESAINHWYGYAYSDGVRYFGNSDVPTDEGIDTPLAFDYGLARTPPTHPDDPSFATTLASRLNPCDSADHTQHGYDDTPDYDAFWKQRDYRKDAARFRAAVLVVHGWQDYNVKQEEGVRLFESLPVDNPRTARREGVPFKRMYLFQGTHEAPTGKQFQPLLDAFFAHMLLGVRNGVERGPAVITQGRTASGDLGFRSEPSWPVPQTASRTLYLARTADGGTLRTSPGSAQRASYTDMSTAMEEQAENDPASESQWLFYASPPLARATRMVGSARLAASLAIDRDTGQLDPVLVDVAPDGTTKTVSRGFMNLQYRNGVAHAQPVPAGRALPVTVTFKPQDQTFQAGHRIGVLVMSSNTVWAIPSTPGTGVTVLHGGRSPSRLVLPLVGAPSVLFR